MRYHDIDIERYAAREFNHALKVVRKIRKCDFNYEFKTEEDFCKEEDMTPELFYDLMEVMRKHYTIITDSISRQTFLYMVNEGVLTDESLEDLRKKGYTCVYDFTHMTFEEFTKLPASNKTKLILIERMIERRMCFKDYREKEGSDKSTEKMKKLLSILKAFNEEV